MMQDGGAIGTRGSSPRGDDPRKHWSTAVGAAVRHVAARICAIVAVAVLSGASLTARAAPEVGWWWNPSESGRGFFVESQGGIFYLAGYFYDADGRATWAVAGGPNADPYRFDGRLLAYANGQPLFGDYRPPSTPVDIGAISVSFRDDVHGTLTWPGGTVAIERQRFGSGTPSFEVSNGWWWNEAESGRGFSIEQQGDKLFVAGFMYDDAGRPVWYYAAGPMASPTRFVAPWLQFSNGQTMTGPYQPPAAPVEVGRLEIEFGASDQAVMTFVEPAAATAAGASVAPHASRWRSFNVRRQFRNPPRTGSGYAAPAAFRGRFTENRSAGAELGGGSTAAEFRATAEGVVWALDELPGLIPFPYRYSLESGELKIQYRSLQIGGGAACEVPWTTVTTIRLGANDGSLEIGDDRRYRLNLAVAVPPAIVQRTCTYPGGSYTYDELHDEWMVVVREEASVQQEKYVTGEKSFPSELGGMSGNYTLTWYFEGGP